MFSAATPVAFLVSRGPRLASIAEMKMIQSVSSFFMEFPTGVVADG
jgi:hypothetical protein